MAPLEDRLLQLAVVFALVLTRVGAVVATAPLLSDSFFPVRARALLAAGLAGLATPLVLASPAAAELPMTDSLVGLGALAAGEAVIGVALGLGLMVVLSGVQLTGQIVGQMSGMALAEGSDPVFGSASSVFGQAFYFVTAAVFVAAGGPTLLFDGLLDTFDRAPVGGMAPIEDLAYGFIGLLAVGFELGLRASAPLLVSLFLATLVLGLISRTLPQINTIAVGFGINALLTLGVMTAAIGAIAWAFQGSLAGVIESVVASVGAADVAAVR